MEHSICCDSNCLKYVFNCLFFSSFLCNLVNGQSKCAHVHSYITRMQRHFTQKRLVAWVFRESVHRRNRSVEFDTLCMLWNTLYVYIFWHSTVFVYRCVLTVFMDFTFVIGSQNASTITMIYNSMFVCEVRFVKMIIIEFEYIVFGPFDLSQEIINRCIWCRDASAIKSKIHMPVNSATTNRTIDIHLGYNVPIIISKPIRVGQWICAARIQFVWFYLTENNANSIESFFSFFSIHVSP